MQTIKKIGNIKNKIVILRTDFNVPIGGGKILDTFRIDAAFPSIDFLIKKGAKVVILSHLGKGGSKTLMPVAKYLSKKKYNGFFETSDNLEEIRESIHELKPGEVLLVENIRKWKEEELNDKNFAVFWASCADFYVNDAFSVSHRNHASIVGLPKYLPSFCGFQLENEIKMLSKALKPKHPFFFILGGAKFETKLPLLKKYLNSADGVFVGGALANTLLEARGFNIGASLNDKDIKIPNTIVKNTKLLLPMDVVVLRKNKYENVYIEEIEDKDIIVDVGTETLTRINSLIELSKLIIWNGPLSKSGTTGDAGTKDLLKLLAKSKAEVIIGGGDTAEVIDELKMKNKFTFVSTGGGATLDFLANGTLPGIKALK